MFVVFVTDHYSDDTITITGPFPTQQEAAAWAANAADATCSHMNADSDYKWTIDASEDGLTVEIEQEALGDTAFTYLVTSLNTP